MSCAASAKCNPNRPGRIPGAPLPPCCSGAPQARSPTPRTPAAVLVLPLLVLACSRLAILGCRRKRVRALNQAAARRELTGEQLERLHFAALALAWTDPLRSETLASLRRWRRERRTTAARQAMRAAAGAAHAAREEMGRLALLVEHVDTMAACPAPAARSSALSEGEDGRSARSQVDGERAEAAPWGAAEGSSSSSSQAEGSALVLDASVQLADFALPAYAVALLGEAPPGADARGGSSAGDGEGGRQSEGAGRGVSGAGGCEQPSFSSSWQALRAHALAAAERARTRARLAAERAALGSSLEQSLAVGSVATIRDELLHTQAYSAEDAAAQATPIWAARREQWGRRAACIDAELSALDGASEAERRSALAHRQLALSFVAAARELRRQRLEAARSSAQAAARDGGDGEADARADARAEELALLRDVACAGLYCVGGAWLACVLLSSPEAVLASLPRFALFQPEHCEAFELWPGLGLSGASAPVGWALEWAGLAPRADGAGAAASYPAELWRCVLRPALHLPALAAVAFRAFPEGAVHCALGGLALRSLWGRVLAPSAGARAALGVWLLLHGALYASLWLGRVPTARPRRLAFRAGWLCASLFLTLQLVWAPSAARACSAAYLGCDGGRACAAQLLGHALRGSGAGRQP